MEEIKQKRGIILTIKKYKQLGFKGFFKKWGQGVDGVTPLQVTFITLISFIPVLVGIVYGIGVTYISKTYWVTIILIAGLPLTFVQIFTNYQKYRKFKQVENTLKQLNEMNRMENNERTEI